MIKLAARLQPPDTARASHAQTFPGPIGATTDIREVALTAWLALQVAGWEVVETEARIAAIQVRLDSAEQWFAAHAASHPVYRKATTRRNRLEREQRLLRAQHWAQQRHAWTACCQLYQALQLMPAPQAWLAANAPEIDAETFAGVWAAVMGVRPLPDGLSYPPSKNGHEYHLPFAPWLTDELSERREKQRAKASQRATPRKQKRGS